MADLDPVAFLRATPPFDALPASAFGRVSTALEVVFHPAGDVVIARDGPPSEHLYVVRKGLVRFERDGETVLVLEPGDLFGFTSVMAGTTPFNVVVERDLLGYRVRADLIRSLLTDPGFARHFSESLADRLRWTSEPARVAAGGDLHLPIEKLVKRAPLVVPPSVAVGEVAKRMSDAQVSAALVDGDPMGIVTDRDFRNRVLARGRGLDTPVVEVATRPVLTVAAGTPVYEAWHFLVRHGVHHLPVARGHEIFGVLTDTDLLRHQTSGPTALFARIEFLAAREELDGYGTDVTRMVGTLVDAGLDVMRIARLVSRLNDALVARLLRLAEAELGPPPCEDPVDCVRGRGQVRTTAAHRPGQRAGLRRRHAGGARLLRAPRRARGGRPVGRRLPALSWRLRGDQVERPARDVGGAIQRVDPRADGPGTAGRGDVLRRAACDGTLDVSPIDHAI